mgnify:FL=1
MEICGLQMVVSAQNIKDIVVFASVLGNELNSFPVDVAFMSSIKKRITLAKKVDKEEFK